MKDGLVRAIVTGWTSRPHPHEPDRVGTRVRSRIPLLLGHRLKCDGTIVLTAQLLEPNSRVDLIDAGVKTILYSTPSSAFVGTLTKGGGFSPLQKLFGIDHTEYLDQLRHTAGPSGLMTRAETRPIVAMKILIE